jgi:hypothetical protein
MGGLADPMAWLAHLVMDLAFRVVKWSFDCLRSVRAQWHGLTPQAVFALLFSLIMLNALVPKPGIRVRAAAWLFIAILAVRTWCRRSSRPLPSRPA